MSEKTIVVVHGARGPDDLPDFERLAALAEVRFADTAEALRAALPGAEVLLGWRFADDALRSAWGAARDLRWIHWGGAGVDAALFEELAASDVVLSNARGLFDRAMAEYTLGLMISMAKGFPDTFAAQREHRWHYRRTELMRGGRVVIVGAGSIGRELARVLTAFGLEVEGVSRTPRTTDADFGRVYPLEQLHARLARADWVLAAVPLTARSVDLFGAAEFAACKTGARFINLGRGRQVDEQALAAALASGHLGGAALDVFREEPLAGDSPLWETPGFIVSPHMSGDYDDYQRDLMTLFLDNLARYRDGRTLRNVVDKQAGFVTATS